jgi:hypothetical protein
MISINGQALPAWRRRVMPWVMVVLRIAMVWLIFRAPLTFVSTPPQWLHLALGLRVAFLTLLAVGAPLFLWPRTCWIGGVALIGAVAAYETLWRSAQLPAAGLPLVAVALIAVLVMGNGVSRAAQRRIYD